jgi:SAM-dependent methyltransferase
LDNTGHDSDADSDGEEDDADEHRQDGNESNDEPPPDPSELESWFDDVGAPAKTLAFLTDALFPLSPEYLSEHATSSDNGEQLAARAEAPTVLDLGTGNGSALFSLRLEGGYNGHMLGVDYSSQSIELARRLWKQYSGSSLTISSSAEPAGEESGLKPGNITFETLDLIHDDPTSQPWWPAAGGFDLVLDKGTFDAISLSSSTVRDPVSNTERRVCELYPAKVSRTIKPGGFLLITSCNWTEEEVIRWFTLPDAGQRGKIRLEVYGRIKYPVFEFGGQKGQGVASVCFRRVDEK